MLGAEPEFLQFDVPGVSGSHKLACTRWGNHNARHTVLCVHGLTRNGRDFDYLARALAEDYQVLCPDMAGRGKSQFLPDASGYNNASYVSDVVFMLAALGITHVHWIGTSMGGIMGMMAANSNPGLIDALVLNDIGALIPASGLARIRDIADFKTSFDTKEEAEAVFRKRCEHFGIREEAQWQQLLAYGIENRNGQFAFTYDPAIFSIGFSKDAPLADVNLWPLWQAVTGIPVLLIRGMQSDILLHETAVEMQSRHPRLTFYEIADTGHAPALMDAKQIALIQNWINATHT